MKTELFAVVDVGSNSVRLMFSDGNVTYSKESIITRLAEGAVKNGNRLTAEAAARTADAVCFFVDKARREGANNIYAFATAAVRNAENGADFAREVKSRCGIDIDIVSGEKEALIGATGALCGSDGGVIDVGGASTEIIVIKGGQALFCRSFGVGSVKLTEICGQDYLKASQTARDFLRDCETVPRAEFTAIGGTATSAAAVLQELQPYDPSRVDGYRISYSDLRKLTERLFSMTPDERLKLKGMQCGREKVIACGCALLLEVLRALGAESVKISEKDNLEGYLAQRLKEEI